MLTGRAVCVEVWVNLSGPVKVGAVGRSRAGVFARGWCMFTSTHRVGKLYIPSRVCGSEFSGWSGVVKVDRLDVGDDWVSARLSERFGSKLNSRGPAIVGRTLRGRNVV